MKYLNTKHSRRKGVAIELAIMLLLVMVAMGIMLVSTTMIQINKQKESFNDLKEITQEIEKMEQDQLNRLILDNIKNFEFQASLDDANQPVDIANEIEKLILVKLESILTTKNLKVYVSKEKKSKMERELSPEEAEKTFPEEVESSVLTSSEYNRYYTDADGKKVDDGEIEKQFFNVEEGSEIYTETVKTTTIKTQIFDFVEEYTFTIIEVKNSEEYIVYSFSVSLKSVETKIVSTIKTCERVATTISTVKTKVGSNDQPLETKNTTYEYVEDTIVESKSYSFAYEIVNQ